jgi:predicted PurR-regulated permease PerM
MIEDLSRRKRNWVLLALVALLLWFAWSIRAVINPLLLGYLFAFILLPAIRRLELRGYGHTASVLIVFSGAALGLALLFGALFVQTRGLLTDILAAAPPGLEAPAEDGAGSAPQAGGTEPALPADGQADPATGWFEVRFQSLRGSIERWLGPGLLPDTLPSREEWLGWARRALVDDPGTAGAVRNAGVEAFALVMEGLRRVLQSLFGISNLALLVPLYAFFMMFEIAAIHRWVARHLPVRYRAQLIDVGGRVGAIVSNFFRGRLLLAGIKSLIVTVPLWLLGVPYSALIGIAAGILSLLPFIGGLLAFVLGFLAASLAMPWFMALAVSGLVFGAAELLEGYVLVPKIMGKSLGLSEVAVLFSITAGGAALGFFGVIVALPLAATLKVLFNEFVEPALRQFAEESPSEPRSGL